jgi:hypothetical protein
MRANLHLKRHLHNENPRTVMTARYALQVWVELGAAAQCGELATMHSKPSQVDSPAHVTAPASDAALMYAAAAPAWMHMAKASGWMTPAEASAWMHAAAVAPVRLSAAAWLRPMVHTVPEWDLECLQHTSPAVASG